MEEIDIMCFFARVCVCLRRQGQVGVGLAEREFCLTLKEENCSLVEIRRSCGRDKRAQNNL